MAYRLLVFSSLCLFSWVLSAQQIDVDSLQEIVLKQAGTERTQTLNLLSNALLKEDLDSAKGFAEEALRSALKSNDKKGTADSHNSLGYIFQTKYDYTNAMKSFVDALKIRNELKDEAGLATSKNNIGCIFNLQENYLQAEENLIEALEIWESLKNIKGKAETHTNLGDVYLAKRLYGKSQEHYKKALDLMLEIRNVEGAAVIANHIGKVSSDLGDHEGALVYYQMTLDLHSSLEDLAKIAEDNNNIALALIRQGEFEEALEVNDISLALRQELNDTFGLAESYKNAGVILAKLHEPTESQIFLEKSVALLKIIPTRPGTQHIYKSISKTYAELNEFEKAYQYQLAFGSSREVIANQEKDKALLELTTKYESEFAAEEQQQTIELLQIQNANDKKIRYFLFVVIALVAMLMLNLFFSYKRKQKDNHLLLAKNEEINLQKEEIDKKNNELEDINSSLDLLNKKLVDEMAEREAIEKSSFARDRFLATMSQEMRTPINIITGLTHLLLDEDPRADQIEHLRTLQFSSNNLVVFINDVLDFSKIEAGRLNLESREFSPSRTFIEIRDRFNQMAKENKKVDFSYSLDEKIPDRLLGDPARLNQIMTNLIATSFKYTQKGFINTTIKLHELSEKKAVVKLRITDSGIGLEPEKIEEMFKSYSKNPNDPFEGYATSNLSLAIAKRLVDLQNGKIEVESFQGEGTTFTVFLPFKLPVESKTIKKEEKTPTFKHLAGNRILLVEDNKINQLVVAKMLRKLDITVITADNGQEAVDAYEKEPFDLVLMDIQMPIMDGYRTTAEIRKHSDVEKRDVPIIALTASAFLTEKEKAKLFGMNDHVGKPFGPDELLEKISGCLEVHKSA